MKTNVIQLAPDDELPDNIVEELKDKPVDFHHFDGVVHSKGNLAAYRPDGSLVFMIVRNEISETTLKRALPAARAAAKTSNTRGAAAGKGFFPKKKDGTRSNFRVNPPVRSGVVGYFERRRNEPICRATAFTAKQVEKWKMLHAVARAMNKVYQRVAPEQYETQMKVVRQTRPEYVIRGTASTTMTVNRNLRTVAHRDQGDLRGGLGVMTVYCSSGWGGCYLCFPRYGMAVEVRTGDVLISDLHEWHGNTPIECSGFEDEEERISYVLYFRENMRHCLSKQDEIKREQRRKQGEPLTP